MGVGFIYQSRSTTGTIKGKMTPTHDIITAIDLLEFYTLCLHLGDFSLARSPPPFFFKGNRLVFFVKEKGESHPASHSLAWDTQAPLESR